MGQGVGGHGGGEIAREPERPGLKGWGEVGGTPTGRRNGVRLAVAWTVDGVTCSYAGRRQLVVLDPVGRLRMLSETCYREALNAKFRRQNKEPPCSSKQLAVDVGS